MEKRLYSKYVDCPQSHKNALSIFKFDDSIKAIDDQLRINLKLYDNCEINDIFVNTVKDLASNFYNYFKCIPYEIFNRLIIDIQAILELCDKSVRDFENSSKALYNVIFTLRSLGIEIEKLESSLEILYNEIKQFWDLVKSIETQNIYIIRILRDLWKIMKDLKEAKYSLSLQHKNFIEENMNNDFVSFSEYISSSNNPYLNSLLKTLQNKSMYFSETLRQIKYLTILLMNHKQLTNVHPKFSYYLIMLLNHDVAKKNIVLKKKNNCCSCLKKNKNIPDYNLSMPEFHLIEDPLTVLTILESSLMNVGLEIHKVTKDVREFHCGALRREEILISTIQSKRVIILRGLNELHNIIMAFDEMEYDNDTLVGKLVKTRPNFKRVNEYLKLDITEIKEMLNLTGSSNTTNQFASTNK